MKGQLDLTGAPTLISKFLNLNVIWIVIILGAFGFSIVDAVLAYHNVGFIWGTLIAFFMFLLTLWIPLEFLSSAHIFAVPTTLMLYNFLITIPVVGQPLVYIIDIVRLVGFLYLIAYPVGRYILNA